MARQQAASQPSWASGRWPLHRPLAAWLSPLQPSGPARRCLAGGSSAKPLCGSAAFCRPPRPACQPTHGRWPRPSAHGRLHRPAASSHRRFLWVQPRIGPAEQELDSLMLEIAQVETPASYGLREGCRRRVCPGRRALSGLSGWIGATACPLRLGGDAQPGPAACLHGRRLARRTRGRTGKRASPPPRPPCTAAPSPWPWGLAYGCWRRWPSSRAMRYDWPSCRYYWGFPAAPFWLCRWPGTSSVT